MGGSRAMIARERAAGLWGDAVSSASGGGVSAWAGGPPPGWRMRCENGLKRRRKGDAGIVCVWGGILRYG